MTTIDSGYFRSWAPRGPKSEPSYSAGSNVLRIHCLRKTWLQPGEPVDFSLLRSSFLRQPPHQDLVHHHPFVRA
jgi:hypothetical protein